MKKILLASLLIGITFVLLGGNTKVISKPIYNNYTNIRSITVDNGIIDNMKNDNISLSEKRKSLSEFLKIIGVNDYYLENYSNKSFHQIADIISLTRKNNIDDNIISIFYTKDHCFGYIDEVYEILQLMADANQITYDEIKYIFSYNYLKPITIFTPHDYLTGQVRAEQCNIITIYSDLRYRKRQIFDYAKLRKEYEKKVIKPLKKENH